MSDDLVRDIEARDFDEDMAKNLAEIVRISVQAGKDESAQALTEARAEIERLTEQALVKDHAIIEAAKLAKKLMTRAVAAESELSTLRARVREVVGPFARADVAIGSERGPFRFETGTGYRLIEREDLRAARQLMEEVK